MVIIIIHFICVNTHEKNIKTRIEHHINWQYMDKIHTLDSNFKTKIQNSKQDNKVYIYYIQISYNKMDDKPT